MTSCRFPPGKTGGLIEAEVVRNTIREDGSGFRRVKPAASLKPVPKLRSLENARPEFPPGKTGGLIEAWLRLSRQQAASCFRRVKPAASLKPRRRGSPLRLLNAVSAG